MCLGYVYFRRKADWRQLTAIVFSLAGLSLLVESDSEAEEEDNRGESPVIGDAMMLIGTAFVGVSNVLQEYLVKDDSGEEIGIIDFLHNIGVAFTSFFLFCYNVFFCRTRATVLWICNFDNTRRNSRKERIIACNGQRRNDYILFTLRIFYGNLLYFNPFIFDNFQRDFYEFIAFNE